MKKDEDVDVKYMSIDDYFEGGDVYPGEYRKGLIAFEVPENQIRLWRTL